MSACLRRHDMVPQAAFVHPAVFAHSYDLRHSLRNVESSKSRIRQPAVVHRGVIRIVPACKTDKQPQNSRSADRSSKSGEPSRTLAGRIAVEVLSLIVGAVLLLMVVAWRACQVVSLNVWRALVWLSNVRRLGKWAVKRIANADSIVLPVMSFRNLVSRVYGSTLSTMMKLGQETVNRSVVETVPVQEEKAPEIEVREVEHPEPVYEDVVTEHPEPVFEDIATDVGVVTGRRLILLRHAKTTWDRDSETPDHDRVLSPQGKEEARLVGSELAKTSWLPDVVLCSDAVRTVQTLSLLDIPDKKSASTTCTEALYYAVTGDEMALAVDHTLGEKGFVNDTTLMVVCHNPGCEELVEQLTGQRLDMGTACAALLEYDDESDKNKAPEDESHSFRLSPQRMRWSLARVIRPSSLSSSSSTQIILDGFTYTKDGQHTECNVQSMNPLVFCSENGGLQTIRAQPFSKSESTTILGSRILSLLYAIPRLTHEAKCRGSLSSTILCTTKGVDGLEQQPSKHFIFSPSQPVVELVLHAEATFPKLPTINRRDICFRPVICIFVLCILLCILFKNFTWSTFEERRRSCLTRIVKLRNQCCRPFQRTHVVLCRERFGPWDSPSDSDSSELYPRATLTLYHGAEIVPPETRY